MVKRKKIELRTMKKIKRERERLQRASEKKR